MPFRKRAEEETSEAQASPGDANGSLPGLGGDVEVGASDRPSDRQEKQPTDRATGHQLFYIFGLDGIGAGVLSGGINFAIAYGMYAHQDPVAHPIRLFQLPNSLAGDAVVTIIIQILITWFAELILVEHDLRNGAIQPIGFVREPVRPRLRWLMLLDRTEDGGHEVAARSKRWLPFVADHAVRIGLMFTVAFFLFWPPAIGILTALGRRRNGGDWDWYYQRQWTPQIFKGVFGGLLALFTTPVMASFWLVREGWRLRRGEAALC